MSADIQDRDIEMLQTKVTPEVRARLMAIEQKYGFTTFKLLRMLIDCIIRFMDPMTNMDESLLRIIRLFENFPGWEKSISLGEGLDKMEITDAYYVLQQREREGFRLVWVERPWMEGDADGWTYTFNLQRMFEDFLQKSNESLYNLLKEIGKELRTESLLDTIHILASKYKTNPDEEELRESFENNDWVNGARAAKDVRYQRHHAHKMEYLDRQPTLFDTDKDKKQK